MAVTTGTAVARLRTVLRDGGVVQEYSNDQFLTYLSEGIRDCQSELSLLDQGYFISTTTFNLTAGLNLYPVPSGFRKFNYLKRTDVDPIEDIDLTRTKREIETLEAMNDTDDRGVHKCFLQGGYIRIGPAFATTMAGMGYLEFEEDVVPAGGYTTTGSTIDTELPDQWIDYGIWRAAAYATGQDAENPGYFWDVADRKLKRLIPDQKTRRRRSRTVSDPYGALGD